MRFLFLFLFLFTTFTSSQQSCSETEGRVERPGYRSESISTNMVYSIYLPPCYDSGNEAYPVIYLMHGSNDDDNHWLRLGLKEHLDQRITAGEIPSLIVVLPFGNWIANENQFGAGSWENVFLTELMPLAETSYRIDTSRRAIGGISRGGFWAFNIAFRYPDLFGAVGGHSGFFAERQGPPEHTPLDLATSEADNIQSLRILLDRGANDYAAPGLELMHGYLQEAGVAHTYTIYPEGEHNNDYWRTHLPEYIDFYVAEWVEKIQADRINPLPTETITPIATPVDSASPSLPAGRGSEDGVYLFLPAAAFPSLLISLDNFQAILEGELAPKLTVATETAAALKSFGISLHPDTQIVGTNELENILWSDRTRFTIMPFDALTPRYRILWINEQHPLDDLENYPLAFESDTPNFTPDKLTRIIVSGVTALTRDMIPVLDENGVEWAGSGIQDYVSRADFFHISNEVSFVENCPESNGQMLGNFCSKPEYFDLLLDLDVDIVELSGNHNNDYGYEAYRETLQWYRDQGIMVVGGGDDVATANIPLIIDHHGNQIAWVSCNWVGPYYALANDDDAALGGVRPGAASCNYNTLREMLPDLGEWNDLVITSVQYWEFDQHSPTPKQREDFVFLAQQGSDVVVGTQAHFPQTYEFSGESFIHYGPGNLFFDQPWWATTRFMLDQLFIYDGNLMFVDIYPGIIEDLGRPRPMTAEERQNFMYILFTQHGNF